MRRTSEKVGKWDFSELAAAIKRKYLSDGKFDSSIVLQQCFGILL